jgi:hypothetical protein
LDAFTCIRPRRGIRDYLDKPMQDESDEIPVAIWLILVILNRVV